MASVTTRRRSPASPTGRGASAARPAHPPAREPLSTRRILQAAFEQVQQHGLAALSTRRLGEQLRCEAMSIYHHFPSKQHLLDAMVDHVLDTLSAPDAGADAFERVRQAFHAYRAMAHRHPAFFPYIAIHRLNTPSGVRFIDRMLSLFRDALGDDELAARYFRVAGYYLMGAGLDETAGYAKGPTAAVPVTDAHIAAHCPALTAAAPYFQRPQWDATFELGLDALLTAMKAAVAPGRTRAVARRARR